MRRLFRSLTTSRSPASIPPAPGSDNGAAARRAFVLLAVALLPIMVLASFDFGATWDEKSRHRYGEDILEYFSGLRSRASFDEDGGGAYGGLFDLICAVVERWVPLERYTLRHIINAIFGWVGVLFCGRLAARVFGTWTGVLAMALLAASPRYFADSMNNPKDLPFAAMSIAALYYFSTLSRAWPYLSWATALKITIALALALNIRAGALLYLAYFGVLLGAYVLADAVADRSLSWRRLADTAGRLAAVSVATMLLGTAFWPWAQTAPLIRPIQALIGFANYDWAGLVLFNGRDLAATDLPWYYAPWWILISTPPVVLAGAVLSIVLSRRRGWGIAVSTLWAVAILPVVMVIVRRSTLYDGIRHLLFISPVLVVLAAAGWSAGLLERNRPWLRLTAAALLAAGLISVLAFDIRSHPNQAVYFNRLVGGPHGAVAKYDMDYWGNCVLEAVAWTAALARSSGLPISVSGNPWQLVQLDVERFRELYFVMPHRRYDLDIRLNRGSAQGVAALAHREDALYRVQTADGAVLCAVLPGPAYADLQPHLVLPPARSSSGSEASTLEISRSPDSP